MTASLESARSIVEEQCEPRNSVTGLLVEERSLFEHLVPPIWVNQIHSTWADSRQNNSCFHYRNAGARTFTRGWKFESTLNTPGGPKLEPTTRLELVTCRLRKDPTLRMLL